MRFKIDWASLIVGSKLPFFVFEGNFQVQVPGGAYIWKGYTWRGLFSEFGDVKSKSVVDQE